MLAMKLGKHTRIQKPLARTLWEVKQLEDAARKYKVQTQWESGVTPRRHALESASG